MKLAHDDKWRVSISGEVDWSSKRELCSLADLLSTFGAPVDFDLSQVSFMDRAGWAAVCAAAEIVRGTGARARIVNPSPEVKRLTDLAMTAGDRAGLTRAVRFAPAA
ncbi:MAG TPA: STAS domain-containing protein [Acidimicrobiales bacterium]|nr:STAS domain-containing protein [Acidimicrobiales bacterium]